ncbi:MAG: hypothetical protein FJ297_04960 [Planctomycetes bacterium]|nr:hypothetical protein [Planctomycetota bacterium]
MANNQSPFRNIRSDVKRSLQFESMEDRRMMASDPVVDTTALKVGPCLPSVPGFSLPDVSSDFVDRE